MDPLPPLPSLSELRWTCYDKERKVWLFRKPTNRDEHEKVIKYDKGWFIEPSINCVYYQRFNIPWTDTFEKNKIFKTTFRGKPVEKAGILLKDIHNDHFVLVQNYGNNWGIPKGSIENINLFTEAKREFKEETGIENVNVDGNTPYILIDKTLIFLVKKDFESFIIKDNLVNIDKEVTAIGKLSLDCINSINENGMLETSTIKVFDELFRH